MQFLVEKISRFMKQGKNAETIGTGSQVYLAAMLEYLIAEVLELEETLLNTIKARIIQNA